MADAAQPTTPSAASTEDFLTDCWYLAAPSAEVKAGKQIRRIILGEPVMLGRTPSGAPFALRDVCPHRLVPLSNGRQIETEGEPTVECPYHGWRFGTDGVCKLMPTLVTDEPYDVSRVSVRRYQLHEANGALFVFVPQDERTATDAPPPPDFGPPERARPTVSSQLINAPLDAAVASIVTPPAEPDGWSATEQAADGADEVEGRFFDLPGCFWTVSKRKSALRVDAICFTPETAATTRVTTFAYRRSSPLAALFHTPSLQTPAPNADAHSADWYDALKRAWLDARTASEKR